LISFIVPSRVDSPYESAINESHSLSTFSARVDFKDSNHL